MLKDSLVTIVIVTFNRAHLIGETIVSVQDQIYMNWECIIVDDGSSDNTQEVVSGYSINDSRIKYYKRPDNIPKGPNASRNYGYEISQGEYIMSLDSDDWLQPDYLKKKIDIFTLYPDLDCVLSKTIMVDNDKNELKKETRTFLTDNLLEDFITLKVSWYIHDTIWRKTFLEGKIIYNDRLFKYLDREFHIRRLAENPKIYLVDEYLALYRIHSSSNSLNYDYKVAESRHNAIVEIIKMLCNKGLFSRNINLSLFKLQVQNIVVQYKNPYCFKLYANLVKKTFIWDVEYGKWLIKLIVGFLSFKIFGKGLRFIQ